VRHGQGRRFLPRKGRGRAGGQAHARGGRVHQARARRDGGQAGVVGGAAEGARRDRRGARPQRRRERRVMECLLLAIYAFFVWLIFIKLKWLRGNIQTQVIVVIIPVVGLTAPILLLNIYAPSSANLRSFNYAIPVFSQVKGRVIEVPVEEGNRLVKKGDVLFKLDPTPYQLEVDTLDAPLVSSPSSRDSA